MRARRGTKPEMPLSEARQNQLILDHLTLPIALARMIFPKLNPDIREDLAAEGRCMMVKLARRYRPGPAKFSTYAWMPIRGCITDSLGDYILPKSCGLEGLTQFESLDCPERAMLFKELWLRICLVVSTFPASDQALIAETVFDHEPLIEFASRHPDRSYSSWSRRRRKLVTLIYMLAHSDIADTRLISLQI